MMVTPMKYGKIGNFPEKYGDQLLAAQNSRSFNCAPCFDKDTIKNQQKNRSILIKILLSIFRPKQLGISAIILRNKVGINNAIPR